MPFVKIGKSAGRSGASKKGRPITKVKTGGSKKPAAKTKMPFKKG